VEREKWETKRGVAEELEVTYERKGGEGGEQGVAEKTNKVRMHYLG